MTTDSEELARLAELHARGALSDEEFAQAKARVLGGGATQAAPAGEAPFVSALNGLRRSRQDRWIGGVCGGLALSSGIAAWVWRAFFIFLLLCGGSGVLVYLLMWLLVPEA
jgi:phage shock protein C